jgi:hypothetical protein
LPGTWASRAGSSASRTRTTPFFPVPQKHTFRRLSSGEYHNFHKHILARHARRGGEDLFFFFFFRRIIPAITDEINRESHSFNVGFLKIPKIERDIRTRPVSFSTS